MPEQLADHDWIVTTDRSDIAPAHVRAAYHRYAEDGQPFIEFKDAQHKLVYTISMRQVVSIERLPEGAPINCRNCGSTVYTIGSGGTP